MACTSRQGEEVKIEQEMQFSLCLSASSNLTASQSGIRRAIGDPGHTEQFELPAYVYIFVLVRDGSNWKMLDILEETPSEEDWLKTRYVGLYQTEGDSIYKFNSKIRLLLEGQNVIGRVYAVASSIPLTFNKSLTVSTITNLADLLDLKMDVSSNEVQANLQNIYTTPYNYTLASSGEYYGTFSNISTNVAPLNLLLYHVAAKVDIQWNVPQEKRINADPTEAIRLTYMEARYLFNGNAYCFKPMRNEVAALPASGYTIADMVRPTDEGLWWEGRSYFYTIPFTVTGSPDYFPLQMRMCTNGTDKADAYRPTLNMQIDTTAVFVPWMRATFNLTAPLENKAETKTVNI